VQMRLGGITLFNGGLFSCSRMATQCEWGGLESVMAVARPTGPPPTMAAHFLFALLVASGVDRAATTWMSENDNKAAKLQTIARIFLVPCKIMLKSFEVGSI